MQQETKGSVVEVQLETEKLLLRASDLFKALWKHQGLWDRRGLYSLHFPKLPPGVVTPSFTNMTINKRGTDRKEYSLHSPATSASGRESPTKTKVFWKQNQVSI